MTATTSCAHQLTDETTTIHENDFGHRKESSSNIPVDQLTLENGLRHLACAIEYAAGTRIGDQLPYILTFNSIDHWPTETSDGTAGLGDDPLISPNHPVVKEYTLTSLNATNSCEDVSDTTSSDTTAAAHSSLCYSTPNTSLSATRSHRPTACAR